MLAIIQQIGDQWLWVLLVVTVLYIALSAVWVYLLKGDFVYSWMAALAILCFYAVASPVLAVMQPNFWSFIGLSTLLWFVMLLSVGFFDTSPKKEGGVVFLLPFMLMFVAVPCAVLARMIWW